MKNVLNDFLSFILKRVGDFPCDAQISCCHYGNQLHLACQTRRASSMSRVSTKSGQKAIPHPATAQSLATRALFTMSRRGMGMTIIATAVNGADLVILSTLYDAAVNVTDKADFAGKIVIDVSNPVTADFSALQVGSTSSAAEEIARLMPGATAVKAFNTIFARHYAMGLEIGGQKLQTFIASDDEAARETVKRLAEEMGLEARDAGPLSNARYLEPLGFMDIQFGYVLGQGAGIAPQWLAA